jgi:hypothetical protein
MEAWGWELVEDSRDRLMHVKNFHAGFYCLYTLYAVPNLPDLRTY